MPFLSVQIQAAGPLVDLLVGVSTPRQDALTKAGLPVPTAVPVRALIDTGASLTSIDKAVIQSLGLTPTGVVLIHTPTTGAAPHPCNQYDLQLTLVHPKLNYIFHALPIIESDLSQQGIQGLIGRDVLAQCLFTYNGQENFYTLAF